MRFFGFLAWNLKGQIEGFHLLGQDVQGVFSVLAAFSQAN